MRNERGQVTVEALLIFGGLILILLTVSIPNVSDAEDNARDVQFVSDARYATEHLASLANTIANPYEEKRVRIYIPGYRSVGNAGNASSPLIHMGTRICSPDGSNLVTTVLIVRRNDNGNITLQDDYNFTVPLNGYNWTITASPGTGDSILEDTGRWRNFTIKWKSINATDNPAANVTCNLTAAQILAMGF